MTEYILKLRKILKAFLYRNSPFVDSFEICQCFVKKSKITQNIATILKNKDSKNLINIFLRDE